MFIQYDTPNDNGQLNYLYSYIPSTGIDNDPQQTKSVYEPIEQRAIACHTSGSKAEINGKRLRFIRGKFLFP